MRSHVLLLVSALLLLQFPQFLSGTAAISIFAGFFVFSLFARPRIKIIYGPLAAFVALMALSAFWSESIQYSLIAAISAFIIVVAGLAVGSTLPLATILKVLHRSTVIIGLVSLAMGIALPSVGLHSGPAYVGTLIGPYISKNSLAAVIMFGFLAMMFREREGKSRVLPNFWSLMVYVPVLVWTQSATTLAILAIGIAFRVAYGFWRKTDSQIRNTAFAVLLTPAVLLIVFAWSIYTGALNLLDRDVTLTGRTDIWAAAIDAWKTQPWFGFGWGSFEVDSTISYFQYARYGWVRNHAHSGYVQVLTELGIVGAAMLVITLLLIFIAIIRTVRNLPALSNGWLLASFTAFIAHNIAEQSMRLLPLFILALVAGSVARQRVEVTVSRQLKS